MDDRPDGRSTGDVEFLELYERWFRQTSEPVGILTEGRVVDLNDAAERLLAMPRREAIGRSTTDLGWFADPREREEVRAELDRDGTAVRVIHVRQRTGEVRDVYVASTLIRLDGRMFVFWIGRDITGREISEEEAGALRRSLRESTTARRRLAAALIVAAERDRHRIADEIRARPIQWLTAALLALEVPGQATDEETLARVRRAIADSIQDLRRTTVELRPPVLAREGLAEAIRVFLREFEAVYGVRAELDDDAGPVDVTDGTATYAYRCVYEVLPAAHDRGGLERVRVSLAVVEGDLLVTIVLEGASMPASPGPDLGASRDLFELIGGELVVEEAPGRAVVRVRLPADLS
jgi:PAS domain S-box-containing protein